MSTMGLNKATIQKYIREQEPADRAIDNVSVKEMENPFRGGLRVDCVELENCKHFLMLQVTGPYWAQS